MLTLQRSAEGFTVRTCKRAAARPLAAAWQRNLDEQSEPLARGELRDGPRGESHAARATHTATWPRGASRTQPETTRPPPVRECARWVRRLRNLHEQCVPLARDEQCEPCAGLRDASHGPPGPFRLKPRGMSMSSIVVVLVPSVSMSYVHDCGPLRLPPPAWPPSVWVGARGGGLFCVQK